MYFKLFVSVPACIHCLAACTVLCCHPFQSDGTSVIVDWYGCLCDR